MRQKYSKSTSRVSSAHRQEKLVSENSNKLLERKIKVDLNFALEQRNLRLDSMITKEQFREIFTALGFYKNKSQDVALMNEINMLLIPSDVNPASSEPCILVENLKRLLWAVLKLIPFKET